jgi:hypothetical protein
MPNLASLPSSESCMPISNLAQRRRPQAKVPSQGPCTVGARDDIECFERPPRRVASSSPADPHTPPESVLCSPPRRRGPLRARPGSPSRLRRLPIAAPSSAPAIPHGSWRTLTAPLLGSEEPDARRIWVAFLVRAVRHHRGVRSRRPSHKNLPTTGANGDVKTNVA